MRQVIILFAYGVRRRVSSLLPCAWHVAGYRINGNKVVVTRISRAYYEEVEDPGESKVAFRTGNRVYDRSVSTREVREAIAKAFVHQRSP